MKCAFFLAALLFCAASAFAWPGVVVQVQDGDTITVRRANGQTERVRLYGVDCPELHEPGGPAARDFVVDLATGRRVDVQQMQEARSYGRLVALVLLPDGRSLQEALLRAGLASVNGHFCTKKPCDKWQGFE